MSNYLAIATVTAALSQSLQEAINVEFSGAEVTNARPYFINDSNATETPSVNVYLYQVTRNTALSNADLPIRNSRGKISTKPAAAIDLHYLVTFYGNQADLEPERLAGIVIRTMHTNPVLSRKLIQDTVNNETGFPYLANSDLADAVEQVKFSPIPFSLEELSKLWSVFLQTSYTLSVAYVGTMVLIEAEQSPVSSLPVRERNIYVKPFEAAVIESVEIRNSAGQILPQADANSVLVLNGRGMKNDITKLKIAGVEIDVPLSDVNPQHILLDLSRFSVPDGVEPGSQFTYHKSILRAGSMPVQVVHQQLIGSPPTPHIANESNVTVVMLRPVIAVTKRSDAQNNTILEIDVDPPVHKKQHVVLLLNQMAVDNPESYALIAPQRSGNDPVTQVVFQLDNNEIKPGDYLIRLQVDGVQSELATVDGVYSQPQESIP